MKKITDIGYMEEFFRKNEVVRGDNLSIQEEAVEKNTSEWIKNFEIDIQNILNDGYFVEWEKGANSNNDTIKSLCDTLVKKYGYDENLIYSKFGSNEIQKIILNSNSEVFKIKILNFAKKMNILIKRIFLNKSA